MENGFTPHFLSFEQLAELIPAIVYVARSDKTASTLFVNSHIQDILGISAKEWMANPDLWHQRVHPDDLASVMRAATALRVDGPSKSNEYRLRRPDGNEVWIEDSVRLVSLKGEHEPVYLGVMIDITELKRANEKLLEGVLGIMDTIGYMVELQDPYTAGHESRVGDLGARIALELGLDEEVQEGVRMAGAVHDVGKVKVPAEILTKPTSLTAAEFALVKEHPQYGYEVLRRVEFPWPVAEVAYQHHERIDGSGYPRGLKGDKIIIEAKIIAVADVLEAMSTHRPYRPELGLDWALSEIENNLGTLYDPDVGEACLQLFRQKGYELPPVWELNTADFENAVRE